jgi:hypothetical protein
LQTLALQSVLTQSLPALQAQPGGLSLRPSPDIAQQEPLELQVPDSQSQLFEQVPSSPTGVMQAPLQLIWPEGQHRPLLQKLPPPQMSAGVVVPQPPQLLGSVCSSTQAWVAPVPQRLFGLLQTQLPVLQSPLVQVVPQAPQLVLVLSGMQFAAGGVAPQLSVSGGQMQVPPKQAPPAQTVLQPPQLRGSVLMSVQA